MHDTVGLAVRSTTDSCSQIYSANHQSEKRRPCSRGGKVLDRGNDLQGVNEPVNSAVRLGGMVHNTVDIVGGIARFSLYDPERGVFDGVSKS